MWTVKADCRLRAVFVLFGNDLPIEVRDYRPVDRQDDLTSGIARDLVDQIANQLGATIMA